MTSYIFDKFLQNNGWHSNVAISVDENGIIRSIDVNSQNQNGTSIKGFAIPGFQNAHSHAFQYAMAGLAELHSNANDSNDFWSWRNAMYKLALSVNPDQMEAIATMLYAEMLRHGYTNVAEFHYLHHDQNGQPYANLAEMGSRLIRAAKNTGINITLVPIFYQKGGFGINPLDGQKRFISQKTDDYLRLLETSELACSHYSGANVGIGIHSMRGVEPKDIVAIAKSGPQHLPFHIHIAEQLQEVESCLAYLNKRPVEWLAENIELSDRFHLVHATHLVQSEIENIAQSGANVVICPSTEGNLGDGIFPLNEYQKLGGKWSIGTDSHVGLNPFEELRLLDYGQRLISHNRKTFANTHGDSGLFGIETALLSGRKAMNNFKSDYFAVGQPLNACILSGDVPLLESSSLQSLLSTMLYSTDSRQQWGTISNGKLVVKEGKHIHFDKIKENFRKTISELGNR